jgi:hypothetical protein
MAIRHNSKIADREPAWGDVDKGRLPRAAFADAGEPASKSTWGYPHHWVADGGDLDEDGIYTTGTMYLHRGGLNAAWSAAQGGRSGEKASAAVISHLQAHRRAVGAESDSDGKDRRETFLVQSMAAGGGIEVQDEGGELGGGMIGNVAVLTAGMAYPATGEPFEVDDVMLDQVAVSINAAAGGVKCRISHPELGGGLGEYLDSIFYLVGRCRDARISGNQVRADVHLGAYADDGPQGPAGTYLRGIARRDPAAIGMSLRYIPAPYVEREGRSPIGRVAMLTACDFVGTPGGNPAGLLAGKQGKQCVGDGSPAETFWHSDSDGETDMNKRQRKYLQQIGLVAGADETQVEKFLAGLSQEQKEIYDALAGKGEEARKAPDPGELSGERAKPAASIPPAAGGEQISDETRRRIGEQALEADRKRRQEIVALAKASDLPEEWAAGLADRGVSVAHARELVEMARTMRPLHAAAGTDGVRVGEDRNLASLSAAMEDAICLRAGAPLLEMRGEEIIRDDAGRPKARAPHERALRFRGLSIGDMAREYLSSMGVPDARMLGIDQAVKLAMDRRAQIQLGVPVALAMGTSDFTSILSNTVGKSLRAFYELAPITWPVFCQRETNPDFKVRVIAALSEAPSLVLKEEGGEVRYAQFSDNGRNVQVATFSRGVRLTREAMVNDDLGAFRSIPMLFGRRSRDKEDDVVYALLNANGTIDGGLLFNATAITTPGGHANLATSAHAPDVTRLDAAYAAMGVQRGMLSTVEGDDGPAFLNITPTVMLVPHALRGTAEALINVKDLVQPNRYKGNLAIVPNARLDAASAAAWYLVAPLTPPAELAGAPMGVDTIAVCFLESQQSPVVRNEQDFATLDIKIACEHIVAAYVIDWRGLYMNAGV